MSLSVLWFIYNLPEFTRGVFAYTYPEAPIVNVPHGTCNIEMQIYELVPGGFIVPKSAPREHSQPFEGHIVYEYFYPACEEKNNEYRPELFKFGANGSVEMEGNFVVMGDRTMLLHHGVESESGFGYYHEDGAGRIDEDTFMRYLSLYSNSRNAFIWGNANINQSWNVLEKDFQGPSVYFDKAFSRLELSPDYYFTNAYSDKIVETNLADAYATYLGNSNEYGLNDPSAFEYRDNSFYIADRGNHRMVKFTPGSTEDPFLTLGNSGWNWQPEGVAVDEEGIMYITDSADDIIYKTGIDGAQWGESRNQKSDTYFSQIFISGEEIVTATGTSGATAKGARFKDKGFSGLEVKVEGNNNAIGFDPVTKKISAQNTNYEDTLFGEGSFLFDGSTNLYINDHNAFNFNSEEFTIDTWCKFKSTSKIQTFFSQPFSVELYWNPDNMHLGFNASYKIERNNEIEVEDHYYSIPWAPEIDQWYHLALVRMDDRDYPDEVPKNERSKKFVIYINGVKLWESESIANPVYDSNERFLIGAGESSAANANANYFHGVIDNFRISKGLARWTGDEFYPPYYFSDPAGITIKDGYLYIADKGNNRIVKLNKGLWEWHVLGDWGSGLDQFNEPKDIYYNPYDEYFYIIDSGNSRVIKTDPGGMTELFGNASASWQEFDSDAWHTPESPYYEYGEYFERNIDGWTGVNDGYSDHLFSEGNGLLHINSGSCSLEENFGGGKKQIGPYLTGHMYSDRIVTIKFRAMADVSGTAQVFLTRHPGASREIDDSNADFNLIEDINLGSTWQDYEIEFFLPGRISTEEPKSLFIAFNSCSELSLAEAFVYTKTINNLSSITSAIDGTLYTTDINNAKIIHFDGNGGLLEIFGGKNPHNSNIEFINPVDLAINAGTFYILDSVTDKDLAIQAGGERKIETFGTDQEFSVAAKFNGSLKTTLVDANGVYAKLNYPDNQVWVDQDVGAGLAHCPEIENEAERFAESCWDWISPSSLMPGFEAIDVSGRFSTSSASFNVDCRNITGVPESECVGQWGWNARWPTCNNFVPGFMSEKLPGPICEMCNYDELGNLLACTSYTDPLLCDSEQVCEYNEETGMPITCYRYLEREITVCEVCRYDALGQLIEPCTLTLDEFGMPIACNTDPICVDNADLSRTCTRYNQADMKNACSVWCEPVPNACERPGTAVRWRPNYKSVQVRLGILDTEEEYDEENTITIRLFHDLVPSHCGPDTSVMEGFIRDAEDGLLNPYPCNCVDVGGTEVCETCYHDFSTIADLILDIGIGPGGPVEDYEEVVTRLNCGGKLIGGVSLSTEDMEPALTGPLPENCMAGYTTVPVDYLPIFPGARGFGTNQRGAYSETDAPTIIVVNNLGNGNSLTPSTRNGVPVLEGSFNGAVLLDQDNKIIMFEVSGWIDRVDGKALYMNDNNVAILGQTAPYPGIGIMRGGLRISGHNILLQHIRILPGTHNEDLPSLTKEQQEALGCNDSWWPLDICGINMARVGGLGIGPGPNVTAGEVYNVVADHVTAGWQMDDNGIGSSAVPDRQDGVPRVHDITVMNSIYMEGLHNPEPLPGNNGKGLLISAVDNLSFYNNLLHSNFFRNPTYSYGCLSMVQSNNLIYNPKDFNSSFQSANGCNGIWSIVNNVVVQGPQTGKYAGANFPDFKSTNMPGHRIHIEGNIVGPNIQTSATTWHTDGFARLWGNPPPVIYPENVVASTPIAYPPGYIPMPAGAVQSFVTQNVGAWSGQRLDSIEGRVIREINTGTGNNQKSYVIHPEIPENTRRLDSGDFGGIGPIPANPHADDDGDGYTNLENWYHALAFSIEGPGTNSGEGGEMGGSSEDCVTDISLDYIEDRENPLVSAFNAAVAGQGTNISWEISDSGGSGLNRIEIWRAPDNGGRPGVWKELTELRQDLSATNPAESSGAVTDSAPEGAWWYGLHVYDEAGNLSFEPAPIRIESSGQGDTISPQVSGFSVVVGSAVISWEVSDSGGSYLERIEIWRAPDKDGQPGKWVELTELRQNLAGLNLNHHAGTVVDDTPLGAWWYGMHVYDGAGNYSFEPRPIRIEIYADGPHCTNGTPINTCSEVGGLYCNENLEIKEDCVLCPHCFNGWVCDPNSKKCKPATEGAISCGSTCDGSSGKLTITSTKGLTWKLDFGIGSVSQNPEGISGGVAYNLHIPANSGSSIDGYNQDSCCNALGLDNHEWRWRVNGDEIPASCPNVVGAGTRADIGSKSKNTSYTLVKNTPEEIVFRMTGTLSTQLSDAVAACAGLSYLRQNQTSIFRRTTTVTPDGYTVEMEVDYDGTTDQDSMWWTIAQIKNSQSIPLQYKVSGSGVTAPYKYTPHSGRTVGWQCDNCGNSYPYGKFNVPYTINVPLTSPSGHNIYYKINTYGSNPYGGTPNNYEFWHKDGYNSSSDIGNYSVFYPRWGGKFKKTTYKFNWTWDFMSGVAGGGGSSNSLPPLTGTCFGTDVPLNSCLPEAPHYCNSLGAVVENCSLCGCRNDWECSNPSAATNQCTAPTTLPLTNSNLVRGGWDNRYFKYNNEYPYIVGMDLQQLANDTGIDYEDKINLLAQYDINKVRIWLITSFMGGQSTALFPWQKVGNKFDLFNWNPAYWQRLRSFISYAEARDIIVEISIFEILGPHLYFEATSIPYAFHNIYNIQNFGTSNASNHFLPEFFTLNYRENSINLQDIQKMIIDKTVAETENFNNVYYEIMNEFPGPREFVTNSSVYPWQQEMARYLRSKTSKIVTVHPHGNGYSRTPSQLEFSSAFFWDEPYIDGLNFHLYEDSPNDISNYLTDHQQKGKMLINNEGAEYYDIDRSPGYPNFILTTNLTKLYGEIRHAWGHMTAGGYFTVYHGPVPQVGGTAWIGAAKFAQAMRNIVETVHFWEMKPIQDNGTELDNLVTQGPAPFNNWQVLANEGNDYIIYFWGTKSNTTVNLSRPAGTYRYNWYDTREWKAPLLSGITSGGNIPVPPTSTWDQNAGVVLVVSR